MVSSTSACRTSSIVKPASNRRMNGPIAQLAVLSFAFDRSRADRPSKSRRLTSLPKVAPTTSPSGVQASTTSGSGLFQLLSERTPISPPWPTDDSTGDLEKISASGPIATSRYWDHIPSSMRAALSSSASWLPGMTERMPDPTFASSWVRICVAFAASPRARSSITRSIAERAKVTPAALIHCRSMGERRDQFSGRPSATDPISIPPSSMPRASAPDTLETRGVKSKITPRSIRTTLGPSGDCARPMNRPLM